MALNDPHLQVNDVYKPRLKVLFNGTEVPFALSAEITSNNWYQADNFHCEFAIWASPDFGPAFWSKQDEMKLDIQLELEPPPSPPQAPKLFAALSGKGAVTATPLPPPAPAPVSLIIGLVDRIEIEWVRGVVRVTGRDLTSHFIDHRLYGAFPNQTSSQIVTTLAKKYGMEADVDATTTPVTRYYEGEHDEISNGEFHKSMTEWDLMTFLAQHEGDENGSFNVWVSGNTLHFKKAVPIDQCNPWIITVEKPEYDAGITRISSINAMDLRLQRSLTLAKDVQVVVRSWNSEDRKAYNVGSPKNSGSSKSNNPAQKYVFVRPNLTKDAAQKLADNMRADITKHERIIEWSDAGGFKGSLALTPRDAIELQGTQSSFDQRYYIDSIARHIGVDSGLKISVKAKNHSTESQAIA